MRPRIMYIEQKSSGNDSFDSGPARIGLATFSKSGRTVYYQGKAFHRSNQVSGNHVEVESGDAYWITGPKKNGANRNYSNAPIEIDEDVRERYWVGVRGQPHNRHKSTT